jgi:hypothetical protein
MAQHLPNRDWANQGFQQDCGRKGCSFRTFIVAARIVNMVSSLIVALA